EIIEPASDERRAIVERAQHADVLRALAGKEKGDAAGLDPGRERDAFRTRAKSHPRQRRQTIDGEIEGRMDAPGRGHDRKAFASGRMSAPPEPIDHRSG